MNEPIARIELVADKRSDVLTSPGRFLERIYLLFATCICVSVFCLPLMCRCERTDHCGSAYARIVQIDITLHMTTYSIAFGDYLQGSPRNLIRIIPEQPKQSVHRGWVSFTAQQLTADSYNTCVCRSSTSSCPQHRSTVLIRSYCSQDSSFLVSSNDKQHLKFNER